MDNNNLMTLNSNSSIPAANCQQQQQIHNDHDDFDEITPMQLDQRPVPEAEAAAIAFYANGQKQQQPEGGGGGGEQPPPLSAGYGQQQSGTNFFPAAASVQTLQSSSHHSSHSHQLHQQQQPTLPISHNPPPSSAHQQQFGGVHLGQQQQQQMSSSSSSAMSNSSISPVAQQYAAQNNGQFSSPPPSWQIQPAAPQHHHYPLTAQHHQQQHYPLLQNWQQQQQQQITPLRKESMPALHFSDHRSPYHQHHNPPPHYPPFASHHHSPIGGGTAPSMGYSNGLLLENPRRSMSTAMLFCSPRSSLGNGGGGSAVAHQQSQHHANYSQQQQQPAAEGPMMMAMASASTLSPNANNKIGGAYGNGIGPTVFGACGNHGQTHHQHSADHRRTKSTVLPPTNSSALLLGIVGGSRTPSSCAVGTGGCSSGESLGAGNASFVHSLRRFHSQLRSPCRYPPTLGPTHGGYLPPLKPYTPPPILSPMRQGSGLFSRIVENGGGAAQKDRKQSSLALLIANGTNNNSLSGYGTKNIGDGEDDDEMLLKEGEENGRGEGDRKDGNGIKDNGIEDEMTTDEEVKEDQRHRKKKSVVEKQQKGGGGPRLNGHHTAAAEGEPHLMVDDDDDDDMKQEKEDEFDVPSSMMNGGTAGGAERPQRKNGTILFAADGPSSSGLSFAAELEQLRKQSSASYRSHKASMFGRMSIRHGKLSMASEDFLRKISSISMEEQAAGGDAESVEKPPESDSIPHINLGKNYQARVKKWADRAISTQERAAIADRDEQLFLSQSIEHIPQEALAAYETLACSVALPKPGRNKELALHILAENQGNLQAAVMDLLRCDTLDWEQYPAVYNSRYVDVDTWTAEEINSFQDAIYKSEKDFQQVANELGNRTVHECVAFYYSWKKACPDDYRKLRNLRRKRQLLEQQLDLTSFDHRQPSQSEKSRGATSEEEEDEDLSETESDITNPSLLGPHQPMECSPVHQHQQRKHSFPPTVTPIAAATAAGQLDPLTALLHQHQQQQNGHSQGLFNGANANGGNGPQQAGAGYPWLHGTDGIFPSPSSSATSNNDGQGGNNNGSGAGIAAAIFGTQLSQESHEGGENGGAHHVYAPKIRHHHNHHHHNHNHGTSVAKKGAQPQADGFFHCRLCEKRFEKVKSLNAHMKSHAMKARAEAEAQQKQQKQHQPSQLAFPLATKKDPLGATADPVTSTNPLAGALANSLGMQGLTNPAQAAMAALNNLGRQIQQQQQQQGQTVPFGGVGNAAGFGLLRNMLQYGQQHANGNAAGAQAAAGAAAAGWPGLEQHFSA